MQATAKKKDEKQSKVLLYIDEGALKSQRTYLRVLADRFTLLAKEWNSLDLKPEFMLQDIDRVERHSPEDFIKLKVIPALKEQSLGGVKASPEKIYELMDKPDFTLFNVAYSNVLKFIKETRANQIARMEKAVEYNSAFFILDNGELSVNEQRLKIWYEKNCQVFAATPNQEKAWKCLQQLAQAMNEMKTVENSTSTQYRTTVWNLRRDPGFFLRNSMDKLLKVDEEGNFVPDHEWVLKH